MINRTHYKVNSHVQAVYPVDNFPLAEKTFASLRSLAESAKRSEYGRNSRGFVADDCPPDINC